MSPLARRVVAALAFIAALVAIDRLRQGAAGKIARVWDSHEVFALPAPAIVHRAFLGYDDAAASVLWASTLYQYGEHVGRSKRFPFAVQYLQTITYLSPAFRPAYRFASTLVTMQTAPPSRAEIDATRALLAQGTEVFPDDAEVWGAYATFLMYDATPHLPANEKLRWRVAGAEAAQRAVELGYFLDSIGSVGAKFLDQAGHRSMAIAQLKRAYAVAPNDEVRAQIAARLGRMEGLAAIERLRREQAAFIERWRADAPFADETLFRLLDQGRPQ